MQLLQRIPFHDNICVGSLHIFKLRCGFSVLQLVCVCIA